MSMETPNPNEAAPAEKRASGSSFYTAMRILPQAQRDAMFEIYSFCRAVDDVADSTGPREQRVRELAGWRDDIAAIYAGNPPPALHELAQAVQRFGLKREDFLAVIDGMEMDVVADIRAPDYPTLELYCDRVACAVGRLSVKVFGLPDGAGIALADQLGRALQLTNILRDLDEDAAMGRLYLPADALRDAGITTTDPLAAVADPRIEWACHSLVAARPRAFRQGRADHGALPAPQRARAAADARGLSNHPRAAGGARFWRAAHAGPHRQAAACLDAAALRDYLMPKLIHIIGAGLAGLAAAVRLSKSGARVVLHEAANQAGGRCRSYDDPALGMAIDNGNHLVLSGNRATMEFVTGIGARDRAAWARRGGVPDGRSRHQPTLDHPHQRRPPAVVDLRCVRARPRHDGDTVSSAGALAVAALRSRHRRGDRVQGSGLRAVARPAAARRTQHRAAAGVRRACRRSAARDAWRPADKRAIRSSPPMGSGAPLSIRRSTFIAQHGGSIRFGHRLRALAFDGARTSKLDFGEDTIDLAPDDAVIVAVPPPVAADLLPGLTVPTEFCAIVNAHYRFVSDKPVPPMMGALNGLTEWLFAFPDRLSVTISAANRLLELERETLANKIWHEVAQMIGSDGADARLADRARAPRNLRGRCRRRTRGAPAPRRNGTI